MDVVTAFAFSLLGLLAAGGLALVLAMPWAWLDWASARRLLNLSQGLRVTVGWVGALRALAGSAVAMAASAFWRAAQPVTPDAAGARLAHLGGGLLSVGLTRSDPSPPRQA